jgi:hypothetical protein
LACGGITKLGDAVDDADGDGPVLEVAVLAEAPAAVGCALAALVEAADPGFAAALAEAAASAAFLADTAVMSSKSKDRASAKPTINVMTGVAILMPRGTQRGPRGVQRFRRT